MKISSSSIPVSSSQKRIIILIIPFEHPVYRELHKLGYLSFKLWLVPADADSMTYELMLLFFSTGTPEELLLLLWGVTQVIWGQNLTTGPQWFALLQRLLEGDILAAFNHNAPTAANETIAAYEAQLQALTAHVFPRRAYVTQKRYMRRSKVSRFASSWQDW